MHFLEEIYQFRLRIHWCLFLNFELTLFRWWLNHWRIYASLAPNTLTWVDIKISYFVRHITATMKITVMIFSMTMLFALVVCLWLTWLKLEYMKVFRPYQNLRPKLCDGQITDKIVKWHQTFINIQWRIGVHFPLEIVIGHSTKIFSFSCLMFLRNISENTHRLSLSLKLYTALFILLSPKLMWHECETSAPIYPNRK